MGRKWLTIIHFIQHTMKMTFIPLVFFTSAVMAQERATSAGGEVSNSTGSVSYSIGLPDYVNSTSADGSITQGVQQPYELFALGVENWDATVNIVVFPNPTTGFITVTIDNSLENVAYTLTDLNGKIVKMGTLQGAASMIDLSEIAASNYYLNIQVAEQLVRSYQLVKNH
jgi:hypothetical protein